MWEKGTRNVFQKAKETNGWNVCDWFDCQKNPDSALVAGLRLPKQQSLFYDCQTVSFQVEEEITYSLRLWEETVIAVDIWIKYDWKWNFTGGSFLVWVW